MSAPKNLELEQAVLGALLYSNGRALIDRMGGLRSEHFADVAHALLFSELRDRLAAGRPADGAAMLEWARININQGGAYLAGLMECAPALDADAAGYALELRALARRRAVLKAAEEGAHAARIGDGDALTQLERRLSEIAADHDDADAWTALGEASSVSVRRAIDGHAKGISTGIEALDECTGGIQPGALWVIGGATSMGKSIVGAALSRNIAAQGYGVGEHHLEMDETQIGLRAASGLSFEIRPSAGGNAHYLSAARRKLSDQQWDRMRAGASRAAQLPIFIDARPGRTLAQIEAASRRLFRRMGKEGVKPGALLIDHEGLIAPAQRFPSELEAARARAHGLLEIGKRLGVGVIALSQITKEGSRHDGESHLPSSTDLNYGSALSQAASVVVLIHRKAYYAERKPAESRSPSDLQALQSREATLVIDKARGGQRKHIQVCIDLPTAAMFEPLRGAA